MSDLAEWLKEKFASVDSRFREIYNELYLERADTVEKEREKIQRSWMSADPLQMLYLADVIDNRDKHLLGRIRVRIHGMHHRGLEESQMEIVEPIHPFGGFDDCGSTWVPPVGSQVVVIYTSGSRNRVGYYLGTVHQGEKYDHEGDPLEDKVKGIMRYDKRWEELEYEKRQTGHLGSLNWNDLPPWSTESYRVKQRSKTRDTQVADPTIFGFKTPEKHFLKLCDGFYDNMLMGKRVILQSSKGNMLYMKDDWHFHPDVYEKGSPEAVPEGDIDVGEFVWRGGRDFVYQKARDEKGGDVLVQNLVESTEVEKPELRSSLWETYPTIKGGDCWAIDGKQGEPWDDIHHTPQNHVISHGTLLTCGGWRPEGRKEEIGEPDPDLVEPVDHLIGPEGAWSREILLKMSGITLCSVMGNRIVFDDWFTPYEKDDIYFGEDKEEKTCSLILGGQEFLDEEGLLSSGGWKNGTYRAATYEDRYGGWNSDDLCDLENSYPRIRGLRDDDRLHSQVKLESISEHMLVLSDDEAEPPGECKPPSRTENNGCFLESAMGNTIGLCDQDKRECPHYSEDCKYDALYPHDDDAGEIVTRGPYMGAWMSSTTGHQLRMYDSGGQIPQIGPRKKWGDVKRNGEKAFVVLKSGYGNSIIFHDGDKQEEQEHQWIWIYNPDYPIDEPEFNVCKHLQLAYAGNMIFMTNGSKGDSHKAKDQLVYFKAARNRMDNVYHEMAKAVRHVEFIRRGGGTCLVNQDFGDYMIEPGGAMKNYLECSASHTELCSDWVIMWGGLGSLPGKTDGAENLGDTEKQNASAKSAMAGYELAWDTRLLPNCVIPCSGTVGKNIGNLKTPKVKPCPFDPAYWCIYGGTNYPDLEFISDTVWSSGRGAGQVQGPSQFIPVEPFQNKAVNAQKSPEDSPAFRHWDGDYGNIEEGYGPDGTVPGTWVEGCYTAPDESEDRARHYGQGGTGDGGEGMRSGGGGGGGGGGGDGGYISPEQAPGSQSEGGGGGEDAE